MGFGFGVAVAVAGIVVDRMVRRRLVVQTGVGGQYIEVRIVGEVPGRVEIVVVRVVVASVVVVVGPVVVAKRWEPVFGRGRLVEPELGQVQ